MGRLSDLVSRRFVKLVVLSRYGRDYTGKTTWLCRCDCGNEIVATGLNLKTGNTKSCGCLRNRPARKNLSGLRVGRLTVAAISRVEDAKVWWECRCDCGKLVSVSVAHLITGHTQSCGCLRSEVSAALATKNLAGKKKHEHPRWNPLISDDQRRMGRKHEHKKWATAVLAREDHSCAACFSSSRLHAHHLRGFSDHELLRYDLANGVALCAGCHRSFHSKYGQRGFDRHHFFECFGLPDPGEEPRFVRLTDFKAGYLRAAAAKVLAAGSGPDGIDDLRTALWCLEREIEQIGMRADGR